MAKKMFLNQVCSPRKKWVAFNDHGGGFKFNPSEKYAQVKLDSISPRIGVKIKKIWKHHRT